MLVNCRVNGQPVSADIAARMLLSDFLRHHLRLTGTHVGCEMGACGACTVIVDGDAVRSCLMFATQTGGCDIRTVESLDAGGPMSVIQGAFQRHHALQCGYCTPGLLMTITAAWEQGALPTTEQAAREFLSGNICRCTGYQALVDVVLELAR